MKILLIFSFLAVILFSCGSNTKGTETTVNDPINSHEENSEVSSPNEDQSLSAAPTYAVEPFEKGENDWGYRIMNGEALFINQPHIPAAQGNSGFSSREKAITAGNFMIYKLNAGIVPPTVSIEELDSLGVLD